MNQTLNWLCSDEEDGREGAAAHNAKDSEGCLWNAEERRNSRQGLIVCSHRPQMSVFLACRSQ